MAYADIADVNGLIAKFPPSATSAPTTTQATALITEIDNEVNVALSSVGVTVPVTAPAYFLGWLGLVVSYGAAAAILKSMFPASSGPAETPAYSFWEKRYQEALKQIRSGDAIPDEITAGGLYAAPSTYFTRNPDEEEDLGGIAEPPFKAGMVF